MLEPASTVCAGGLLVPAHHRALVFTGLQGARAVSVIGLALWVCPMCQKKLDREAPPHGPQLRCRLEPEGKKRSLMAQNACLCP